MTKSLAESAPHVGRSCVYRPPSKSRYREQAAIITGLVGDGFNVHLTTFPVDGDPRPVRDVAPRGGANSANGLWHYPEGG